MKKFIAVVVGFVTVLGLSGCVDNRDPVLRVHETDHVLQDGRTVHCVAFYTEHRAEPKGVSCDWENAG